MSADPIETVSRPYGYKKKQKQTQKAEVEEKQTEKKKKNLKQSAHVANDVNAAASLGLGGVKGRDHAPPQDSSGIIRARRGGP
jgi:hypothetical protein